MTNEILQVALMVLWSTNTMDTFLTPVGDDIIRSTISLSNTVPVLTNSVHLRRAWMDVSHEFPPVPDVSRISDKERMRMAISEPPTNTASTQGGFRSTIELKWNYDTNNTPDVFKLYTSTNLSIPLINWTHIATVSGNVHNVILSNISPQQASFYVTASNWFGESGPSNVAGTPPIPSDVYDLTIGP